MTAMTPANIPVNGWAVTNQAETMDLDPSTGGFTAGYKISFRTGGGHNGSVFLSNLHYTPDIVKRAIDAKAALLDAVGTLTSDS